MGGHAEQVIPFLVGIVLFTFIMAFIISSFGPVAPYTERNAIPEQYNLGQEYDMYSPTYDIASNNLTTYWQASRELPFTHSGVSPVYAHIIRGNTWYHVGSVKPWEKYKDYIAVDFGYISNSDLTSQFALSYATISNTMNTTTSNITHYDFHLTAVTSGTTGNYTLIVEVDHLANKTADLYANNYKLSLAAPHELNTVSFWTALGYILTFNTNWIPTYPLVAQMLSAVIILAIVLCVIRMVW